MKLHFSTASHRHEEKYGVWHEIVSKQFVTADSFNNCEGSFNAELICSQFGRTQVSRFDAPAHKWQRERKHIHADDQDVYLLGILREGEAALEQSSNTAIQRKGNVVLYSAALPFSYNLSGSFNIISIPRKFLDSRAPHARQLLARNFECNPGLMAILCGMIDSLLELDMETQEFPIVRERLASSLLDIILAIMDLNNASISPTCVANPRMEKILTFARANLGDPDLSPADLANVGSVSIRTMNRLFGRLGTTPMRWVLQERVRLSERYLREGYAKTVTEASFMVGFNDVSHFSRSFKQLFGYSPEHVQKNT
ncbi:helix-turn-helix domain-containing protein [Halomonas sp. MC140]|nr:helix-turn-helix domain-containing protein [Halomonas sp. MC140]MDN7131250.1 helix-turn-helix domain-containing protein [Halomonas sp. MC140]